MICEYDFTPSFLVSNTMLMLKYQCHPQLCKTFPLPFILSSTVPKSFSLILVVFSLSLHELLRKFTDCKVFVTSHDWFKLVYGSWDFTPEGQWRSRSYKFGSVGHCGQSSPSTCFCHRGLYISRLLVPLWTHQPWVTISQTVMTAISRNSSFEIYSLSTKLRIQI